MNWARGFLVFVAVMSIGGCATVPTGPSVMVLPAQGKPFEAFQADDAVCRQSAAQFVEGSQGSRIPEGDALFKRQTNESGPWWGKEKKGERDEKSY
jgi:hypothetical protein